MASNNALDHLVTRAHKWAVEARTKLGALPPVTAVLGVALLLLSFLSMTSRLNRVHLAPRSTVFSFAWLGLVSEDEAANAAAWAGLVPTHETCVATMTNAAYFHQTARTVAELRSPGNWKGEIVILPAPDVPLSAMQALASAFAPITFRYSPEVNLSAIKAWHADHPFLTTDGRERSKTFQWHKFRFFEPWATHLCGRIAFIDAGMHVYNDIQPVFDRLDPLVQNRLIAHSDAYQSYWWFNLGLQFERGVCPQCYDELNATVPLDGDYFQTGFLYWDTRITRQGTFNELMGLANRYPMSRTNEQGIMNVWAYQHRLWVPLPTDCKPWCLYDIVPRHFNQFGRYVMSKKLPSGYRGPLTLVPVQRYTRQLRDAIHELNGIEYTDSGQQVDQADVSGSGGNNGGPEVTSLDFSSCPPRMSVPQGGAFPPVRPLWIMQTVPDPQSSFALGFLVHWAYRCRIPVVLYHSRGPHHWAQWWERAVNAAGAADAPAAGLISSGTDSSSSGDNDADSSSNNYEEDEANEEEAAESKPGNKAPRMRRLKEVDTAVKRLALANLVELRWYSQQKFTKAITAAIATAKSKGIAPPTVVYLTLLDLPFARALPSDYSSSSSSSLSGSASLSPWFSSIVERCNVLALVHSTSHLAARRISLRKGIAVGSGKGVRLLPLAPTVGEPALLPVWLLGQTRSEIPGPMAHINLALTPSIETLVGRPKPKQRQSSSADTASEADGFSGDAELPPLPWLQLHERRKAICFVGRDIFDSAHTDQEELAAFLRYQARFAFSFLPLQLSDGGGAIKTTDASVLSWSDVVRAGRGSPKVTKVVGDRNAAAGDPTEDESIARAADSPALAVIAAQAEQDSGQQTWLYVRGTKQQEATTLFDQARKCTFIAALTSDESPLSRSALHIAIPLALSVRTPLLLSTSIARAYGFSASGGSASGGDGRGMGGVLIADSLADASRRLDRLTPSDYDALLAALEKTRLQSVNANWAALAEALAP